jgi:hypothetical protein
MKEADMNVIPKFLIGSAALAPALAWAHDGHGMPSATHFHASDAWGFAMLAGVAVAVFLLARKK